MHAGFRISAIFALLVCSWPSKGQAVYTATRSSRIQVGAGFLLLDPDYVGGWNRGISFYADDDFSHYFGIEADVHLGGISTPGNVAQNSYLIGPRLTYRRGKLLVYGKIMVGRGTITNQITKGASSYGIYAYGGGLEYRVGHRFNVRPVDVAVESWPNFYPHTLTPVAVTLGIGYIVF
jgi:hypothetical protein